MPEPRDLSPEPFDGPSDEPQQPGERHALVIGIDRYQDAQIRDLSFAKADARSIHDILIDPELGRFDPANVTLLLDEEATERRIRKVLAHDLPDRAGPNDTVVVYFAGHGSPVVARGGGGRDGMEKYLVPVDAELSSLRASGIPMERVQTWFDWMSAKQVLFFLDCCYSGAAEGRTVADSRSTPRAALSDEFLDKLGGDGRVVVTACDVNEVSLESPELSHGIFTHYLAEGLKGAADRDQDGLVTIDELYDYVHENVERRARQLSGKMTPVKRGSVRGRIYLTRYETGAQKEGKALAAQARAALERGADDEAERLWGRVLELVPGHAEATARVAAVERERKREAVLAHSRSGAISLKAFNHAMAVLELDPAELSDDAKHVLDFIDGLTGGSVSPAVFGRSVEMVLKSKGRVAPAAGPPAPAHPTASQVAQPPPAPEQKAPTHETATPKKGVQDGRKAPARKAAAPTRARAKAERPSWAIPASLVGVGVVVVGVGSQFWPFGADPAPPAPPQPVIEAFRASATSITAGDQVTLTWSTTEADRVELQPGGPVALSGDTNMSPRATTTYALVATGPGGERRQSVRVDVAAPASQPAATLTAQPTAIERGGSTTLRWSTTDATSVRLDGASVQASGSRSVSPTTNATYRLEVTGPSGTLEREVAVAVTPPPAPTPAPTRTPTPAPIAARTPPPAAGDPLNTPIFIEGGTFSMGEGSAADQVTVSGFWIQEHEVTNEEYRRFDSSHQFPSGQERYPVINVNWQEAMDYAASRGGSLPTEAQWEFATRGTGGRTYPWGNAELTCQRAQYNACDGDAIPVMSRSAGATPEGVHDLAGNVWEWVRDWYGDYPSGAVNDPTGPGSGQYRVLRGGAFGSNPGYLRGAYRNTYVPVGQLVSLGFRVAWSSAGGQE